MTQAPTTEPTEATVPGGLLSRTDHLWTQLARYVVVGGLAFVVDFGAMIALTELAGIPYLGSAAIAFLLGLITNYVLSIGWVFNRRAVDKPWAEFALFTTIGVFGLVFNEGILWALTGGLGVWYPVSKIVSTAVVFGWNFTARKVLLFR
ncbi:MAG: GtrA family protein [Myxococcota bacterium]